MELNKIYELECVDLNHYGEGVCKRDGFTIFVRGILPGEVGLITITKLKKTFGNGRLVELLKKSNSRVTPICPIFEDCGGCDIMHLSYDEQLKYKLNQATETLRRLGNINYNVEKIIGMDEAYYYRNKVQIPLQMKKGRVVCGYYRKETHDIVEFTKCYIQTPLASEIAIFITSLFNKYSVKAYNELTKTGNIRHLLIRNNVDNEYMIVFITKENKISNFNSIINELINKFPEVKSIYQNINSSPTNIILNDDFKLIYGEEAIIDKSKDLNYYISPNSFFQTNHIQTEKLYQKVIDYARANKNEVIVDAYCGVGTIALTLAKQAKYVYGIEIVEQAILDANKNKVLNKINNVEFIIGKSEEEIKNIKNKIDTIIIDPPRKGCDEKLLSSIIEMQIEKIVYVSCNIATLARDLEILAINYEIKDICLVDMFPQTAHIETIMLLERKQGKSAYFIC